MKLLGTLSYKDKKYNINDTKEFISLESLKISEGFYGGRVTQLATTEEPGLYMCMEVMVPIDLLLVDTEETYTTLDEIPFSEPGEDFNEYTVAQLKECLEAYDIEYPSKSVKADLIQLLKEHLESI